MAVRNLMTDPPALPLVAPSILAADFADLGAECRAAVAAGADLLHLDVMDGHFVPNLTMGPALCRSLRRALGPVFLDAHLMVSEPARFVEPFAEAGADHLTVHVEVIDDPRSLADAVHGAGMSAGLALSPGTPVDRILPVLDAFELILVMSVEPGFAGQAFLAEVLGKTRAIHERLRGDQRLQMDGGIDPETARPCVEAGCDVLVAASSIFGAHDYAAAVAALRGSGRPAVRSS